MCDFSVINLRLVFWPSLWALLSSVLYAFGKNVYYGVIGLSVLVRSQVMMECQLGQID